MLIHEISIVNTNNVLELKEALKPYQSRVLSLAICEITFRLMWWRINCKDGNNKNKLSPLFRLNLLAEPYESIRSRDELDCGLRRRELSHEDMLHSQDLNSETVTEQNFNTDGRLVSQSLLVSTDSGMYHTDMFCCHDLCLTMGVSDFSHHVTIWRKGVRGCLAIQGVQWGGSVTAWELWMLWIHNSVISV
jgi:hypothetical protein